MSCTLIILNYNDSQRAVTLARRCQLFSSIKHIVVVDNCSTDDSLDVLRTAQNSCEFDLCLALENKGFASGNNIGAKYAIAHFSPDYLLFANTDTEFTDDDIIECLNVISNNPKIGLLSMRMKDSNGKEERSSWRRKTTAQYLLSNLWLYRHLTYLNDHTSFESNNKFQIVDIVRGSFMLFNAKVLESVGYFDEGTFLYYEEECISQRLRDRNFYVASLTDRYYVHRHISKGTDLLNQSRVMNQSLLYYLRTYRHISLIVQLLFMILSAYSLFELRVIALIKSI